MTKHPRGEDGRSGYAVRGLSERASVAARTGHRPAVGFEGSCDRSHRDHELCRLGCQMLALVKAITLGELRTYTIIISRFETKVK